MSAHIFGNKTYDVLKHQAQITLPAVATLYFALSQIWGMPYGAEVVGTITALDTFLGILLGYSSKKYNEDESRFDGEVVMTHDVENDATDLNFSFKPDAVMSKSELVIQVKPPPPQ